MSGSAPYVEEICPSCTATFVASVIKVPGKGPSKICPHCQTETSLWRLIEFRKGVERGRDLGQRNVLHELRGMGAADEREAYQIMTAALVGCYDKLLETTPKASHGVVIGAFGTYIKLAKAMLGVVACLK